jgi:predicted acetyltransferase
MKIEEIKLIEPIVELKSEFLAMTEEFKTEGSYIIDGIGIIDKDNFEDSVRRAKDHAKGIGLPQGWVPANTYWLVCQRRIIGTCDIRHRLTEALRKFGGHIGYAIRPLERGKGYGSQMLALALEKAQALGIKQVLVTCADNNIASVRVIEKNGGKLADKIPSEKRESLTRRYWIDL